MLTLLFAMSLEAQVAAPLKVCDQVHLWTTAAEAEAIRRCEAERPPEDRLRRDQAAEPGRVAGQSNAPEHRAARRLAMNGQCAEARAQAAAIGDVPLAEWIARQCGAPAPAAPARPPRPDDRAPPGAPVNLWD